MPDLDIPDRPRTRAWVKQEEERKSRQAARASAYVVAPAPSHREEHQRSKASKDGALALKRDRAQPLPRTASRSRYMKRQPTKKKTPAGKGGKQPKRQHSKGKPRTKTASKERSRQTEATTGPQGAEFAAWLSRVEPVPPEGLHQPRTLFSAPARGDPDSLEDMASSSTSRDTGGNGSSTVKIAGSKSVKVSESKLRLRRVSRETTDDGRLEHLKSILTTSLPRLALKDIPDLRFVAENFIQQIIEHP